MGIEKEKQLNNGFSGNYWRIDNININKKLKYSTVSISLYKDKETADKESAVPIDSKVFTFSREEFPFDVSVLKSKDIYQIAYEKIKESKPSEKPKDWGITTYGFSGLITKEAEKEDFKPIETNYFTISEDIIENEESVKKEK